MTYPIAHVQVDGKGEFLFFPATKRLYFVNDLKVILSHLDQLKVKYLGKHEGEATWEPNDCIPSGILKAYEKQQETVVESTVSNYSGQISSTLKSVLQEGQTKEPPEKKRKPSTRGEMPDEG